MPTRQRLRDEPGLQLFLFRTHLSSKRNHPIGMVVTCCDIIQTGSIKRFADAARQFERSLAIGGISGLGLSRRLASKSCEFEQC